MMILVPAGEMGTAIGANEDPEAEAVVRTAEKIFDFHTKRTPVSVYPTRRHGMEGGQRRFVVP